MKKWSLLPPSSVMVFLMVTILLTGLSPRPTWEKTTWEKLQNPERKFEDSSTIDLINELISLEPWREDLWLKRGEQAMQDDQPQIAIESYKRAESISPLSSHARILLARAYQENGDLEAAKEIWRGLTTIDHLEDEAYIEIYRSLMSLDDLDFAMQALNTWQKANPNNPDIEYYLGIITITSDQDSAVIHLSSAEVSGDSRSPVIGELIRFLQMEDTDPAYRWLLISQALYNLNELNMAKATVQIAIDESPEYAEAWCLLGEIKERLGMDGYQDMVTAQKLDPRSNLVKATLSIYWRRKGHPEAALLYLNDLSQSEPKNPAWQIELANAYIEMQDLVAAMDHFQAAIEIDPGNVDTWQRIAEFCLIYDIDLEGLGGEAVDRSMALAPEDGISLDLMGWMLMKKGDFDNAIKFFRKSINIDPIDARAHMHLGQGYMNLDRPDEARLEFQKAIDLSDDTNITIMAQRLLDQLDKP